MTDLPHTNEGYIQSESTDFRRATDKQIYQQLGSDINYMLDQTAAAIVNAAAAFLNATLGTFGASSSVTNGSGNASGIFFSTPNNQQILFALINAVVGSYRCACPLIIIPGVGLTSMPLYSSNGTSRSDTGNFPLVQGQITGPTNNNLYCNVLNGDTGGGSPSPIWAGGSTATVHYSVVYKL